MELVKLLRVIVKHFQRIFIILYFVVISNYCLLFEVIYECWFYTFLATYFVIFHTIIINITMVSSFSLFNCAEQ